MIDSTPCCLALTMLCRRLLTTVFVVCLVATSGPPKIKENWSKRGIVPLSVFSRYLEAPKNKSNLVKKGYSTPILARVWATYHQLSARVSKRRDRSGRLRQSPTFACPPCKIPAKQKSCFHGRFIRHMAEFLCFDVCSYIQKSRQKLVLSDALRTYLAEIPRFFTMHI